jgi:hypothetical protein
MLADDLEALRQYKKRNSKVQYVCLTQCFLFSFGLYGLYCTQVDRKASKGRRLRYTVHAKLQSYMFPIPVADVDNNTDRLLKSLFQ